MHTTYKPMLKIISSIFFAIILALLPLEEVFACKCASGETKQSRFNKADYVAHVKITAAELRDASELSNADDLFREGYVRVSFEEIEVIKGEKFSPTFLTELPFTDGNCTLGLRPGWEYVIFLAKESNGFVFGCSGSFPLYNDGDVTTKIQELREWAKGKQ
ncbi:hypothetical protein [Methylomonas sp. DH-1]|uniref:hypothetical protein n=1 Tax=Methylomonas sp. (strain DH-1) TaxID=1727196 RepID=UPI0007C883A4|nr:hypothetical protein [Methylomonas sp. DH-1]ANE56654.1 hypothetical protein AYM39_16700 [Methylomonas sp. DH-1]